MKIIHRISTRLTELSPKILASLDIVKYSTEELIFTIDESHEHWSDLMLLLKGERYFDLVTTEFTEAELRQATWLNVAGEWMHGYPQPDDDHFGYINATYDTSEYCERCGIGLMQKALFQMRHEPKWGRRSIMQLNWVFDEYFVKPHLWETVFQPIGIGCKPVLNTRGAILESVVQLEIKDVVELDVAKLIQHEQRCTECLRLKYGPWTRGMFPRPSVEPQHAIVRSMQYFGSGAAAHKKVFISNMLYRSLDEYGARGIQYWPVEL